MPPKNQILKTKREGKAKGPGLRLTAEVDHINVLFMNKFGFGIIEKEQELVRAYMTGIDGPEANKAILQTIYLIYARDRHFKTRDDPYEERTIRECSKLHLLLIKALKETCRKLNVLRADGRLPSEIDRAVAGLPNTIWFSTLEDANKHIASLNAEMATVDFVRKPTDPVSEWFSSEAYAAAASMAKKGHIDFETKLFRNFGDLNTLPGQPRERMGRAPALVIGSESAVVGSDAEVHSGPTGGGENDARHGKEYKVDQETI
ncbi:hypothetical protein P152DRAFT_516632 [Eremomyces bilateralis CBS 781.70]|uniref:Uncharacterized protein n=1 Tax=Eremomyces bilateralis CBS 781.70 TaxID=1392243 RepID=A0A6G1FUR4_9PEZI|nr:uncharacterized protein P152DRAFT_516632 [Eremomyces bilateralis CBS 781.70]KAF1809446.1 hypothetical protein P152DRAFT_516632 [Eremomyces bilateralis CBS 781.70]